MQKKYTHPPSQPQLPDHALPNPLGQQKKNSFFEMKSCYHVSPK